jgi:hypothetical protein
MLKFHEKCCFTCRYYRSGNVVTDCLNLGRTLSFADVLYADRARYCDFWKKRPKTWDVHTDKNPFWEDKYIPREVQLNLPGRKCK